MGEAFGLGLNGFGVLSITHPAQRDNVVLKFSPLPPFEMHHQIVNKARKIHLPTRKMQLLKYTAHAGKKKKSLPQPNRKIIRNLRNSAKVEAALTPAM